MTGRRLEPQKRREQLLDTGAAMFAERPYDDVFVEEIAARAGVSSGPSHFWLTTCWSLVRARWTLARIDSAVAVQT